MWVPQIALREFALKESSRRESHLTQCALHDGKHRRAGQVRAHLSLARPEQAKRSSRASRGARAGPSSANARHRGAACPLSPVPGSRQRAPRESVRLVLSGARSAPWRRPSAPAERGSVSQAFSAGSPRRGLALYSAGSSAAWVASARAAVVDTGGC